MKKGQVILRVTLPGDENAKFYEVCRGLGLQKTAAILLAFFDDFVLGAE